MSMIWSSRERNRSCSPLSRRSRGRIANPPLHHLEQKNHSLRFVRILKTEFARNSPSRGPNLANSITWPRTISPSVQWLENSSRTTIYLSSHSECLRGHDNAVTPPPLTWAVQCMMRLDVMKFLSEPGPAVLPVNLPFPIHRTRANLRHHRVKRLPSRQSDYRRGAAADRARG